MNLYGRIAVHAVSLGIPDASTAWNIAKVQSLDPKWCPKDMFFCLCEANLIKGVQYNGASRKSLQVSLIDAGKVLSFLRTTRNHKYLADKDVWVQSKTFTSDQGRCSVIRGLFEVGYL